MTDKLSDSIPQLWAKAILEDLSFHHSLFGPTPPCRPKFGGLKEWKEYRQRQVAYRAAYEKWVAEHPPKPKGDTLIIPKIERF